MESLPALLSAKIKRGGFNFEVFNEGVSGDTTASGLARLDSVLENQVHIFVLELGANDMLRGIAAETTQANLHQIAIRVKAKYPDVVFLLLGMQLPQWIPGLRAENFRSVYQQVAKDHNMVIFPFLLMGVAGVTRLNMPDGVHPLAEGYQVIAENVWPVLKKMLLQPRSNW